MNKEQTTAKLLKTKLDNHINSDGNLSSILEFNIEKNQFLTDINFQILFEECSNLKINADFIGNSILKKNIKPIKYNSSIVISYDNIHK